MGNKDLRIGVVGYCPPTKFDEKKALDLIRTAYDVISEDFPSYKKTIVSGVTNLGVLKIAYEEGRRRGWKTAGVACRKAFDFRDNWFPLDEEPIIIGNNWGDESETFLKSIDILVRVGGGNQSLDETKRTKILGKRTYEFELPIIK
jgi:hypothetical protein